MTIGVAATRKARPRQEDWRPGYAKGVQLGLDFDLNITALTSIVEPFGDVDDWVNVFGKIGLADGYVWGPGISYAAAYHKTQLLTDNCRASVTIDNTLIFGEARVWVCGDQQMNRYYGVHIKHFLIGSTLSICRGKSSISADLYEETTVALSGGDTIDVWYDRPNSTVRVYRNGAEVCKKYFTPNDIPHGDGCRYTGVTMGVNWLLDIGPNFTDFSARDVVAPLPAIYDPIDGPTVNPRWTVVDNGVAIHDGWFTPPTLGPNNILFTDAAIRWDTQLSTDSCRIVATLVNAGVGKCTFALCSNSAMTNWLGVQFENGAFAQKFNVVVGTGPTDYSVVETNDLFVPVFGSEMVFVITYDHPTKTVRLRRANTTGTRLYFDINRMRWANGNEDLIAWTDGSNAVSHGSGQRHVGMVWETGLLTVGVEASSYEAYNVTADTPLP